MSDYEKNSKSIIVKHVMTKTFEIGSVIGVSLAIFQGIRRNPFRALNMRKWGILPSIFSISGLAAGYPLTQYKFTSFNTPTDASDRAFRIIHNRNQNRVDMYALRGALCGLVFAVPALPFYLIFNGVAAGCTLGLVAFQLERQFLPSRHALGFTYPPWKIAFASNKQTPY